MLDAGHSEGSGYLDSFHQDPERGSRRQYTVKGIEAETIDLMRDAARKEGMKIGSWISMRMKEAAEKALTDMQENIPDRISNMTENKPCTPEQIDYFSTGERLSRIERELVEIGRAQRIIMSRLLENI